MNNLQFESEYALEQFRETQSEYYDENGKAFTGGSLMYCTPFAESVLDLINKQEQYIKDLERTVETLTDQISRMESAMTRATGKSRLDEIEGVDF